MDPTTHVGSCTALATREDVETYSCYEWLAKKTCAAARDSDVPAGSRLTPAEQQIVEDYYQDNDPNDVSCYPPSPLQNGALKAALLLTPPRRGAFGWIWQHGLQVLPTASIGIPLGFTSSDNDARKAIASGTPVAGAFLRYSPVGFWVSVHAFAGTMAPDKTQLDPKTYPNPALLLLGFGIDFLGMLNVTWVDANLRPSSIFNNTASSCGFVQFGIDLTGTILTVAGTQQKPATK